MPGNNIYVFFPIHSLHLLPFYIIGLFKFKCNKDKFTRCVTVVVRDILKVKMFLLKLRVLGTWLFPCCQYCVMWDQIGRRLEKNQKAPFSSSDCVFQSVEEGGRYFFSISQALKLEKLLLSLKESLILFYSFLEN